MKYPWDTTPVNELTPQQKTQYGVDVSQVKEVTKPISQQPTQQETTSNIFGYEQGTKEKPITKDTKPIQTPQQRASQVVEQIQIRGALPVATATIPQSSHISIQAQPQQEQTIQQSLSPGYQQRIEALTQREKNLQTFKTNFYERIGIDIKQGDSYLIGVGKSIAQTPFELGSQVPIIGGRIAFAGESLFQPQGRQELVRAAKETPGAVISSYDIRKPQGLVNLGLTVLAVKGTADAISISKSTPSFNVEETVTKRTITPEVTVDSSQFKMETISGKKTFVGTGTSEAEFINTNPEQGYFEVKGSGKFNLAGKTKTFDTGGFGVSTEEGSLLTTRTYVQGGKGYLSTTETAGLVEEPFQAFKGITSTQELVKGNLKPTSVSTFMAKEVYVEDVFKPGGQSIFRKEVMSESGTPIAREQLLETSSVGVNAETFKSQFEGARGIDYTKIISNKESFKGVGESETILGTKGISLQSSQGQAMQQIAKQELIGQVKAYNQAQVAKNVAIPKGIQIIKTETMPQKQTFQIQQNQVFRLKESKQTTQPSIVKPEIKGETKIVEKAIPIIKSKTKSTQATKSAVSTKPIMDIKTITEITPVTKQTTKQIVSIRQVEVTKPNNYLFQSTGFGGGTPPPGFTLPKGGLNLEDEVALPKITKVQKHGYTPSIEAEIFNIHGKAPKYALSGLTIRPIVR